MLVRERALYKE